MTKNAYNVAKILTNSVILQNHFRKLSFLQIKFLGNYKNKNKFNVTQNFAVANLMPPGVSEVSFFHVLYLPRGFLWKV